MDLTVTTFVTMDGVMQAPGGPQEDPRGGFTHGGWLVPHFDQDAGAQIAAWFERAEEFLLGRYTYDTFHGYWPQVTDPSDPIATKLNALPKHVVSTGDPDLSWTGARRVEGNVVEAVRALQARPGRDGELQVHGSAGLVQILLAAQLVDELRLIVFPVVIGSGKRLFGDGAVPGTWGLVSSSATSAGAIIATYRPAGPLTGGEFGIEDGAEVRTR